MFDLFRSRAKAVRILLGVMLGMVALSMLVYLIPGAGTPTIDRNDQIVAEIGKDAVTLQDVEMQIQQQLKSNRIPPDLVQVIIPQQVDQMIEERALAYQAHQLGFEVSDQALASTIRSTQFGSLTPQQYRDAIEQQMGKTVSQFENDIRSGLALNALESLAIEGSIVSPADVEAEYRRRNEKVKLDYLGFDPAKLASEVKPTPEQLKAYYDKNKNFFTQPETRDVQLIIVDQAQVVQTIQVSDAQIESYYNSHKDQYRTPERVQARHLLIKTTGKSKEETAQLKAKADDLLKQIQGGADFAKVAEKNSEDPGSAAKGGDLGWIVRGQMVKNFEDTKGPLSLRLVAALEGGQAGGGDTRGQQSAALIVVKKDCGVWLHNDTVLRLQVDDNPEPIKELRRLVEKSIPPQGRGRARPGCEGVNGGPR